MLEYAARFAACFVFSFFADIFWVLWSNATKPTDKRWRHAFKAAFFAVMLAVPAMFNTLSWLTDHTYAVAILLGMFFGTTYAVRREQRKIDG